MKQYLWVLIFAVFFGPGQARASEGAEEKITLVFCVPGLPGTTVSAQPYVDKMLRRVESKTGLAPHAMTGKYLPSASKCIEFIEKKKPEIALLAPQIFASERSAQSMQMIAKVIIEGRADESYFLVVHKNGPASVAQLKGKTIAGAVVGNKKFVANVLLEKKLASEQLQLKVTKRALKALRDVARGKVDGAIVDRAAKDNIPQLAVAADLKVIHETPKVPPPVLVLMGSAQKDTAKYKRALQSLCDGDDGANLCKTLTISAIQGATLKEYKTFLRKMSAK